MAYTNPRTWVDGEKVNASIMNQNVRDNMNEIFKYANLGDLMYGNSGSTTTKLAIGSEGEVLRVVSGIPAWQSTLAGRVGGDPDNWNTSGSDTYSPTNVIFQCGKVDCDPLSNTTVTFPIVFADGTEPIVFMSPSNTSSGKFDSMYVSSITRSAVIFRNDDTTETCIINWLAIGQGE